MVKTSEKIKNFCLLHSIHVLPPRRIILTPNSTSENFYFLERGFIRSFVTSVDGNELSISIFKNNSLLPLNPYFEGDETALCFYETLTESELRIIPKGVMGDFLRLNPDARSNASSLYIQNVNRVINKAKQLIYHDCSYRIISTLVSLAENLGDKRENTIDFNLNISHELIASFAGTTRETATRKLGELKSKGLIQTRYGRLKILNLNELNKIIM